MTASELNYFKLKFPFASSPDTAKTPVTDNADGALTFKSGISPHFAHCKDHDSNASLITTSLVNGLMNFSTMPGFFLQSGCIPQVRMGANGVVLDPTTGDPYGAITIAGERVYKCPNNAVLPMINETDSKISYYYYDETNHVWQPIGLFAVMPDNPNWASLSLSGGAIGSITADRNLWLYLRAICIPSFTVAVNGVAVSINMQNITSALKYHGSVAYFTCLLLKKGDVCTISGNDKNIRIEYKNVPCVSMEGIG